MFTTTRRERIRAIEVDEFDAVVVGAGINGAASAAALAAAGLRTALIDRGDFAGETSSNSSKFIWGGIKYLESHEYRLVAGLCHARNRLRKAFPDSVLERRFIAVVPRSFRMPAWLVYLGAWFYWILGRGRTGRPTYLPLDELARASPAVDLEQAIAGVEYSDCHLPEGDARFVLGFVSRLVRRGGIALNYCDCTAAILRCNRWHLSCHDRSSGKLLEIRAKVLINACGPGADSFAKISGVRTKTSHAFAKGVHLVVPRIGSDERVLGFFANDKRLFFVAPLGSRSCIGTTDTETESPVASISAADRDFILENANACLDLEKKLVARDIVAEFVGVRPLAVARDGLRRGSKALSRKHKVEIDVRARFVTVFGGKLTDCLNVGESVRRAVGRLGMMPSQSTASWYEDSQPDCRAGFVAKAKRVPAISELEAARLWRRYGALAFEILETIRNSPSSAEACFTESKFCFAEIDFCVKREGVVRLSDLLLRRSDLGLVVPQDSLRASARFEAACREALGSETAPDLDRFFAGANEVAYA